MIKRVSMIYKLIPQKSEEFYTFDRISTDDINDLAISMLDARDFTSKGLGYCLIKENRVVSWCLSAFVSDKNFEFGLETIEKYRGNGYGKLTAAACMEYCIENNIIPFWQCNKDNIPSNKVSESIGFEKDIQYSIENFQF